MRAETRPATRLAGFALLLGLAFGAAYGVGRAAPSHGPAGDHPGTTMPMGGTGS